MVNFTKTLAAIAIAAAFIPIGGCQLNPEEDCTGDGCRSGNLTVTPGTIEEPCGGPCGAGLDCLDPARLECPCEPNGWAGTTCVDYQSICSCQAEVTCGDGLQEGSEECDDGNLVAGDGCGPTCLLESCGDGIQQPSEECDDGVNNSDTIPDACRTTCLLPTCGDNVQDTGEQCDHGGESATCDSDCTVVQCGDGMLNLTAGEECDDGNTVAGDGCGPTCLTEACGNGILDPGEECDDGVNNSDTIPDACRTTCLLPYCSDGVIDTGEVCDDGNTVDGDGCSADCQSDESCGNGTLDPGEQCDDGNLVAGDGCSPTCVLEVENCTNAVDDDGDTDVDCEDSDCRDSASCTCSTVRIAFPAQGRLDIEVQVDGSTTGWDVPAGQWYDVSQSQYDNGLRLWVNGTQIAYQNIDAVTCFYLIGVPFPTTPSSACQSIPVGGSMNHTGTLSYFTYDVDACTVP